MATRAMSTGTIGLSHLVEAATSLKKIVDGDKGTSRKKVSTSVEAPVCEPRTVSGDEDVEGNPRPRAFPREIFFPQRLFQMLADASVSDAISWLPHGRSFVIIRPDVFSERVLPIYFHSRASTKYPSFTRKLNRWGFRQVTGGPDTGAFQHPLFRRDQPQQCLNMECEKKPRKRYPSAAGKIKTTTTSMQLHISPKHYLSACSETTKALSSAPKPKPSMQLFLSQDSTKQHSVLTSETFATVERDSKPSQHFLNETTISFTPLIPPSPWVPSDPSLVAATLQASERQEKLAVAKSMLYEAYLNAVKRLERTASSKQTCETIIK